MCRNISFLRAPSSRSIFRTVYVIGDFPFCLYYTKGKKRKQSAKATKKSCKNCTKQSFFIYFLLPILTKRAFLFYDNKGVPRRMQFLRGTIVFYSLYSNIRSYMQTVSPSLTPISSIREKTPLSRRMRSKNIRLS